MFSWVVKVVPQPPEKPGTLGEENKGNAPQSQENKAPVNEVPKPANAAKSTEDEVSEENSTQSGVLTWLSHGFASALPQPVATPKLGRANSDAKEENAISNSKTGEETGMINWIVQGLGKVVPQPDDKYKKNTDSQEVTEVHDVKDVSDAEPLPHVAVVEVVSDEEHDEENRAITPRVMEWFKHGFEKVIPQPPTSPEPQVRRETPTPEPPPPPPPVQAPAPTPVDTPKPEEAAKTSVEGESNMVNWIVQGLGRIIPQPVLKPKEEASDAVQSREKDLRAP